MNLKKLLIDKRIFICLLIFAFVSLFSIGSAKMLLSSTYQNLIWKQFIWYLIGFLLIFLIMDFGNEKIFKLSWILYFIGITSLACLLLFAPTVNDARCWFFIPGIGGIQPSEFVKIILIIVLAQTIQKFHSKHPYPSIKQEFIFLCKTALIVLVPSILTFLQPDTGVVLIYLLITITMLFISGIHSRWFFILGGILILGLGALLIIYFYFQEQFINIFGSSFFLRIDRILDWTNSSGYQLEYGKTAIGAGGLLGYGFFHTPIYFPEPQTDFIFAVYANNTGFIGSLFLITVMAYFDYTLISIALKTKKYIHKYIIAGFLGMLIYQQVQNIGMTFGLLPITGITLPFISYGGSSLLSYFLILGIICNIAKEKKYKNK